MPTDADQPVDPVRAALDSLAEPLRRQVAAALLKSRTHIPADELTDRILAALGNPPAVDRRLRDLSPAARKLLALLGLTRRPSWKVGHLLAALAAVGHADGVAPVRELFDLALLLPVRAGATELESFDAWLGLAGVLDAAVFAPPLAAARGTDEPFALPDLSDPSVHPVAVHTADGLEWPLRMAAVVQLAGETPFRRTQAGVLFKRDLTRLQTADLLSAAASDLRPAAPDLGVLAACWAAQTGGLVEDGEEWKADATAEPPAALQPALVALLAGLFGVEHWDPAAGATAPGPGLAPLPSATLCVLVLLANANGWTAPEPIAEWLWAHHPGWSGSLGKEAQKDRGAGWVEALLANVLFPLRLLDAATDTDSRLSVRLSDLGRHLFAGGPPPPAPAEFPQTLLVQPNAEIIAYRQGLSPGLIAALTRFARWKGFGAACTLELTAEQTYRGLESGLTLAGVVQTLNRHSSRPVPPAVADLLKRWANKRERIIAYAAATLVEFATPADLDAALARGVVAVRVTDRIGLCPNGADPDFKHLRLVGNREFDARPARCVSVGDDGVTLTVDAAQSDLLLDPEIVKLADPLPDGPGPRRFALSPASLNRALKNGVSATELEAWFVARTGSPPPPAARLFTQAASLPPSLASRRLVVQLPTEASTDGLMQWPTTRKLVDDRLGPTAVTVDEANLGPLVEVLTELGLRVEVV